MSAQILSVTSRDNDTLVRLRKLQAQPGAYRKLGSVWLEGEHLCEALQQRAWPVGTALITEEGWTGDTHLKALAACADRILVVSTALFNSVSALESPGRIGFLIDCPQVSSGLDVAAETVVLDRIQDPGNVGSILRSASALGVRQIVALQGTVALWSPKVLRAGMGAHFALQMHEGVSEQAVLASAMRLVITSSHQGSPLPQASLPQPCAWVFGHEGGGVSEGLMQAASLKVCIPQPGGQESLNVAAAAAICLYEARRAAALR